MRNAVILIAVVLGASSPLRAIVPGQSGQLPTDSTWGGNNWDLAHSYVYPWATSSAVAVAPNFLLSAAHVGGGIGATTVINGVTYTAQQIYLPPNDAGQATNPDLQLIRLDKALPGVVTLYSGGFSGGQKVTMLGYGSTGTDHGTYYTMDTPGTGLTWGTNTIDASGRVNLANQLSVVIHSSMAFSMNFNSGLTPYESGYGNNDSGGGTFVKVGNQWELAGINAYVDPQSAGSSNYIRSYAISVPSYSTWIAATVPEPTTAAMVVCGGAMLLGRRRWA